MSKVHPIAVNKKLETANVCPRLGGPDCCCSILWVPKLVRGRFFVGHNEWNVEASSR